MLDYLEQGLAAAGHDVEVASSIESVIDKLSEERFDVFVSDIFQPVLESIALFTTIARTSPRTRSIALMDFKTARAKQYDLSLWVDSVIEKPFTAGRVASEVEFLLAVAARRAASPELV